MRGWARLLRWLMPWRSPYGGLGRPHLPEKHAATNRLQAAMLRLDRAEQEQAQRLAARATWHQFEREHERR